MSRRRGTGWNWSGWRPRGSGRTVIDAEDVSVGPGCGSGGRGLLLDDVTWQLGPGDRVGLIGPNGSGKSTFLRLLAGCGRWLGEGRAGHPARAELRVRVTHGRPGPGSGRGRLEGRVTGEIVRGKTVRLGYLGQGDAGLDPALTPREAVAEVRGNLDCAQGAAAASQLLDRLGLRGDTQWTPAAELSGGERRRVQLLRILVDEPNVLFLDEPTNDLDVDTLTELEDLLDGWPGSLVLVSHDRYFLERVTDHVVALLGDGKLSFLAGGVDEYLGAAGGAAQAAAGRRSRGRRLRAGRRRAAGAPGRRGRRSGRGPQQGDAAAGAADRPARQRGRRS